MDFHITHADGTDENGPSLATLPDLLAELRAPGAEHGSVSLTHNSEWCLTAYHGGDVTLEQVEEEAPVHMQGLAEEDILDLWRHLAEGDIDAVKDEAWQPGCPP